MRKLIIILLILSIFRLNAQDKSRLDSLNHVLTHTNQDTLKIQTMLEMAEEVLLSNPAKATVYIQKAKVLSEKINYTSGMANVYGWLAYLAEQQGEIDTALLYYKKSLSILQVLDDKKEIAICLNNIAAIYKDQGKLAEALETHQKSLLIRQALRDSSGIATSMNNIGFLYANQGQIPKALEYYHKGLKIYESTHDKEGIATTLHNIAGIYKDQKHFAEALNYHQKALKIRTEIDDKSGIASSNNGIGLIFLEENQYDKALIYLQKALDIRLSLKEKQGIAYSYKYLGTLYSKQKKYEQALPFFEKSLVNFVEIDNKWGEATALYEIANSYFSLNEINKAEKNAFNALQIAKSLGFPLDIKNAAELLSKIYEQKQQPAQALNMYKLFREMQDSIQNQTNTKKLVQAQMKYEFDKKEALTKVEQTKKDALAQKELQRQKLIRNGLIGGFVIVMLFATIFFRQRNYIRKGKKRSDELLLNILPEEVAEELKEKGRTDAKMFEEVTVMFTDFKGFTQISELLSPQELVAELDTCFRAFDNITQKYNIEKIKTIGDSYMCVSGLPLANPNHADDIVRAAIEMNDFMLAYSAQRKQENKAAFEMRIGIHTGNVVAGIVGVKKFAYDIWGDTVNVAARMESSGEAGKINISGSTYMLVKESFTCTYRGKVKAKNKGEIDMYFVEK